MEFHKEKLKLRLYQQAILARAAAKNTLVILPTGLGKTFIAIALAGLRVKDGSKIVVLAPTKPLINQHLRTFSEYFDFNKGEVVVFSGEINSKQRAALWEGARVIFSTPQTIKNDIISGRISLREVSLLVFDEAHRAVGDYAYVFIAKTYLRQALDSRILGLTASPGSNEAKINNVCKNLFIETIEARGREHGEVRPYVKPILTDYKFVEFPDELRTIREHLRLAIKNRLVELKNLGFIQTTDVSKISKKSLLALQANLQGQIIQKKFEVSRGLSICAALIKLLHALGLIESESLGALQKYLAELWESSRRTKIRAVKDLVADFHMRLVYSHAQEALNNGLEHPKLAALRRLVEHQFKEKVKSKILIFTEFRANISQIIEELENINNLGVHKFIGQASKTEKGMSQKTQAEVIERFEDGDLNCLVCTSVAEEGLDIPSVDLVVFYSPIPSAIRTIQRRGRTGRQEVGKLAVLITKGTRDENFYWVSRHRESSMNRAIENIKDKRNSNLETYFIKVEKERPEEKLLVFADMRERGEIVDQLFEKGINVKVGALKSGDFILSEDVGVERKEVGDFVSSLLDRRLFEQARNLKNSFKKPLIVVEGKLDEMFKVRRVHPNALWAALASLVLEVQVPILFSSSPIETADLLAVIAKREQLENKKEVSLRGSVKPRTISDAQQFFIEGLPSVGPSLAKALLKEFRTPKAIANASEDDLKKVEKLGNKKAKLIRDLLDKEYKK